MLKIFRGCRAVPVPVVVRLEEKLKLNTKLKCTLYTKVQHSQSTQIVHKQTTVKGDKIRNGYRSLFIKNLFKHQLVFLGICRSISTGMYHGICTSTSTGMYSGICKHQLYVRGR
jgi:hypothetical protein